MTWLRINLQSCSLFSIYLICTLFPFYFFFPSLGLFFMIPFYLHYCLIRYYFLFGFVLVAAPWFTVYLLHLYSLLQIMLCHLMYSIRRTFQQFTSSVWNVIFISACCFEVSFSSLLFSNLIMFTLLGVHWGS